MFRENTRVNGPYNIIYADPPWRFKTYSAKGRDRCPDGIPKTRAEQRTNNPERHYRVMDLADIMALPVKEWVAKDAILFLWAVDPMIPQALQVGEAWGFTFKTVAFYWAKLRRETSKRGGQYTDPACANFPMGTGYWTRPNPEQCLLFTRGKPKRVSAAVRKLVISPRREHSRKPDEVAQRIVELCGDLPRLEMFARTERLGWDVFGNQTDLFEAA